MSAIPKDIGIVVVHPKNNGTETQNCLSICAGVGGLDLGLKLAEPGHRTVCYIERDSFAASVLVARMADQTLCDAPVWDDIVTFKGRPWRGVVDIIAAGYPCQPFSMCGKRQGENDPRHLWPHVARIIKEIKPRRVFLENVEGHIPLGFASVLKDLQGMGYRVAAGVFSARECGAAHIRRRLFILADTDNNRGGKHGGCKNSSGTGSLLCRHDQKGNPARHGAHCRELDGAMALSAGDGLEATRDGKTALFAPAPCDYPSWERELSRRNDLQPSSFGLGNGVAHRMERSYVAGNGVVPLAAAIAYRTLRAALNGF